MYELDTLYSVCELLNRELAEYDEKVRRAGGKMSAGDLDVIDTLTHAIKSAKTTIAMIESKDKYSYENGGSSNARSNRSRENSNEGSYENSYEGSSNFYGGMMYPGRAFERGGRPDNAPRDSMGRYSRDEAEDDLMDKLREYMQQVDEPAKKQEIKRFMKKLGEM